MRGIPYLALLIGFAIAAVGIFGIAAPADFAAMVAGIQKHANIYYLAAFRVLVGVVLMLAAGSSRTPFLLGALGFLIALGGLITPFMAVPLRQATEGWISGKNKVPLAVWGAIALAIGSFIVYATMPKRRK